MLIVDHTTALERARNIKLYSNLDAAFLVVAEQIFSCKNVQLEDAVKLLNNNQILDYAAFLYESRSRQDLERNCHDAPPSNESEREWLLTEDDACLARTIAAVAADLDADSHE